MIYRVALRVGYCERLFEFESIELAAGFAEDVLRHQVPNEDHKELSMKIVIEVIKEQEEK